MTLWKAKIWLRHGGGGGFSSHKGGGIYTIEDTIDAPTRFDAKDILARKYNVEPKDVGTPAQVQQTLNFTKR